MQMPKGSNERAIKFTEGGEVVEMAEPHLQETETKVVNAAAVCDPKLNKTPETPAPIGCTAS